MVVVVVVVVGWKEFIGLCKSLGLNLHGMSSNEFERINGIELSWVLSSSSFIVPIQHPPPLFRNV